MKTEELEEINIYETGGNEKGKEGELNNGSNKTWQLRMIIQGDRMMY